MAKTILKLQNPAALLPEKKRVAAYARVSSGKDAMLHSLSAQVSYFSKLVQNRQDWEFAGIYADEALTGTKESRPEFQRLLTDCRAGQIDMVITKSISRFARNVLTLLQTTRELKALNIDIFFEEQNIHTTSGEGEMILSLLAAVAQEESRSTSENCKWRVRSRFQNGLPQNTTMLGYRYKNGSLIVHAQEAAVVRTIFGDFLSGMGCRRIAQKLNADGVMTRYGNVWGKSSVDKVLRNVAYMGNLMLQKTYTADYLMKKTRFNKGELPMYYVEDSHEPIISKSTFEEAQTEIKRRAKKFCSTSSGNNAYPFTGMITCDICGKHYRRKTTSSGAVWICPTYNQHGKAACPSKQIPESTLYALTIETLRLNVFDEAVFAEKIYAINIPSPNKVIYAFKDGSKITAEWQDRSRSESWTDEMRQQAREREFQRKRSV